MSRGRPRAPSGTSDAGLVRLAGQGESAAKAELQKRTVHRITLVVNRLDPFDTDGEDDRQNATIRVLERISTFRGEGSLESWVDKVTSRFIVQSRRRRRKARRIESPELVEELHAPSRDAIFDDAELAQLRDALFRALRRLSPKKREAFLLQTLLGYKIAEIASLTDATVYAVKERLRLARKELRQRLERDAILAEIISR